MRQISYLVLKGLVVFSLFVLFFSYAMFQGGFVSWFLVYVSLPILLYYVLFIFYPLREWEVERVLDHRDVEAGDRVHIHLKLKRSWPFPVAYLVIEDLLPPSIQPIVGSDGWAEQLSEGVYKQRDRIKKKLIYPNLRRELVVAYQISELPRGVHSWQHVRLTVTDVFGFVTKTIDLPVTSTLSVTPAKVNLDINLNNPDQQLGDQIASIKETAHSNNVKGARQYIVGDQLSAIHWKATAKTGTLMTKEFEHTHHRDGTLVLFGYQNSVAYEWNVAACRTLLLQAKDKHLHMDFDYYGDQSMTLPSSFDRSDVEHVFSALKPGVTEQTIGSIGDRYQSPFNQGGLLLIFTDQLTPLFVSKIGKLLQQKRKINVYLTRSESEQDAEGQALETELENKQINLYLITEAELSKSRGVVTS